MSEKHLHFLLFISLFLQPLLATSSTEDGGQWMSGTVFAKIEGVPAEKAWPFIADFCNAFKIFPIRTSFCTKGDPVNLEVGSLRYMVFENFPGEITWEQHRIESIDQVNRVMTYKMVENTNGMSYYKSIVSVVDDEYGSEFRWQYVAQSSVYTPELFQMILSSTAQAAATNIKNLVASS